MEQWQSPRATGKSIPRPDRTIIPPKNVVNKMVIMGITLPATQEFILSERFTDEIFQKIIRSDGFAKKLEERIDAR